MPAKKPADVLTISELAKMFGLPEWDEVDEMNQDYYWELARGSEDETEAESAAQHEVYGQWYDAVEQVAAKLFGEHGLELGPRNTKDSDRPYELRVTPKTTWNEAATKIISTINGVGYFHFSSLKEFLDSGPYTARQAVLEHLSYVRRAPEVYGDTSPRQLYERYFR
jgi:hypothetical protein